MSGKYKQLFLLFLMSACAKPNYEDSASTNNNSLQDQAQGKIACQAKFNSGDCVNFNWQTLPSETGFGSFIFKTYRLNLGDGTPVPEDQNGELSVVLWMPSMGHGSAPVQVKRLDVGTYQATNIFFTMKGNWEIRFQTKNGTHDLEDQAVIPYSL
jgi:hypothetical protein